MKGEERLYVVQGRLGKLEYCAKIVSVKPVPCLDCMQSEASEAFLCCHFAAHDIRLKVSDKKS